MEGNEDTNVSSESVVVTSINRAIRQVTKGGVVVIIVPGEVVFNYDLPTHTYEDDNALHAWIKDALLMHVVLLKTDDVKIQKVIEISQCIHFDVYAVLDFPEQQVTGSAFSMLSSLPRINHTELEMFGKIQANNDDVNAQIVDQPEQRFPASTDPSPMSIEAQDDPKSRFANVFKKL